MSQTNDTCREAFEYWMKRAIPRADLMRLPKTNEYAYAHADKSWRAWKAAWQARQPLTDEQIESGMDRRFLSDREASAFGLGARHAEKLHGIGAPDQKERS